MPTLKELAAELGIDAATLEAKKDVVTKWDGYFADAERKASEGSRAAEEAQRKFAEAQALQAAIDENIAKFGINDATVAQLQASNAAMKAAMDELKKSGINVALPDIPTPAAPAAKDPAKELQDILTRGFSQIGQTFNAINRYQRVFGKPLPEDPTMIGDKAAAMRMSVNDYMEHTYKISDEEKRQAETARADHDRKIAEEAVAKYKEEHPITAGHPELNGGMPSNFSRMPAPRDPKSVREFSSMSTREKISNAMQRAREAAQSASSAA
jgi:hypothetical protein